MLPAGDGSAATERFQLTQLVHAKLFIEERFGLLADRELSSRDNRRLARLLQAAKLIYNACVEDLIYRPPRGLKT